VIIEELRLEARQQFSNHLRVSIGGSGSSQNQELDESQMSSEHGIGSLSNDLDIIGDGEEYSSFPNMLWQATDWLDIDSSVGFPLSA
jgi:hypothetical protein